MTHITEDLNKKVSEKEDIETKYINILQELRNGKSLHKIVKETKLDIHNLRLQLKKRFSSEYDKLIYGEIIKDFETFQLRKIPKNQTDSNESNLTKQVKKYFIENFGFIDEVGIWDIKKAERYCIDLYNPKSEIGIELYWRSNENINALANKLFRYKSFIPRIYVVLIKDSKFFVKNRSYFFVQNQLLMWDFQSILFDINTPPPRDTLLFLMETK